MDNPSRPLETQILAALKLAMAEGRQDVAEHLLRALEELCDHEIRNRPLAKAYLLLSGRNKKRS